MNRKRIVPLCVIVIFWGCFMAETPIAWGAEKKSTPAKPASTLKNIQTLNHLELLSRLLFSFSSRGQAQTTLNQIAESGDTLFVAGLIDMLRYHRPLAPEIGRTLNQLTGQNLR